MDDRGRLDHRARLGLRLIMRLHEHYPEPTSIAPQHAFAGGEKDPGLFEGIVLGSYEDEDLKLADNLANRLLAEHVIEGERAGGSIYPAFLPAHTRRVLATRDPVNHALLSESIRQALNASALGARIVPGEFTRMARLLGFEP